MYREDLAYIHDQGFSDLAENAVAIILKTLQNNHKQQGKVIDLGCGSGITAQKLSGLGYDVIGVDLSPDLIAIARQRVPEVQFYTESLFTFSFPFCEAVIAIGECLNYLFDCQNTTKKRLKLFKNIYDKLSYNGFFLFDIAETGRVSNGYFKTYTEGKEWVVLMTAEEDKDKKKLTRWITTFRKIDKLYRKQQEVHILCLLDHKEIIKTLENIGFKVDILTSYYNFKFSQGHRGLLAKKL